MMAMPVSALFGLMAPGLQGLMTRRVGSSEQGQLQGANQALSGLASVIGPGIFGFSFAWAVQHPQFNLPGAPLLLAGAITAACLWIAVRFRADPVMS